MYYGSYFYGTWFYNSWYYAGGAPPGPSPTPDDSMFVAEGSKGGYVVPGDWPKTDHRRTMDADEELIVVMGGPLL